jgi:SynChlorMet cassette protein ScmD
MNCYKDTAPTVNPSIVLREESDNWAILFDPDKNHVLGINPMGVCIWKWLDGRTSIGDIIERLRLERDDMPGDAEDHIKEFIKDLIERGLASCPLTPCEGQRPCP